METAPDELHELKEHAEEASRDRQLAPVSLTMAILAVLLAICGTLGHRAHTEETVVQNRVSNQWAYYQAKAGRRFSAQINLDNLSIFALQNENEAEASRKKYEQLVERYGEEEKEIEAEARNLQNEAAVISRRATRFDLGDTFLEIALVITSITLLTRKRHFWALGMFFGAIGVLAAASSTLVR